MEALQPLEAAGLDLALSSDPLGFTRGPGVAGPPLELRRLDDVRPSLRNPASDGPEVLYAIAMDVHEQDDRAALLEQNLLFGICAYAAGRVGDEPVRSQGHVHAVSASCGSSTGELYEFWAGEGIVYMQEQVSDDPGRCFAVRAGVGQKVLVPPGWAHLTVNATPDQPMAFGAWCVRDYGFDYSGIRERRGLAWYPTLSEPGIHAGEGDAPGTIRWVRNPHYRGGDLVEKAPRSLAPLGIGEAPIYRQWQHHPETFDLIPRPRVAEDLWKDYTP